MRHIYKVYVIISIIILIILLCYPTYRVIKTNILPFQSKIITCSESSYNPVHYGDFYNKEYPRLNFPKNFSIKFGLYDASYIEGSNKLPLLDRDSWGYSVWSNDGYLIVKVPLNNKFHGTYDIWFSRSWDKISDAWILYQVFDVSGTGDFDFMYKCEELEK